MSGTVFFTGCIFDRRLLQKYFKLASDISTADLVVHISGRRTPEEEVADFKASYESSRTKMILLSLSEEKLGGERWNAYLKAGKLVLISNIPPISDETLMGVNALVTPWLPVNEERKTVERTSSDPTLMSSRAARSAGLLAGPPAQTRPKALSAPPLPALGGAGCEAYKDDVWEEIDLGPSPLELSRQHKKVIKSAPSLWGGFCDWLGGVPSEPAKAPLSRSPSRTEALVASAITTRVRHTQVLSSLNVSDGRTFEESNCPTAGEMDSLEESLRQFNL